MKKSAVLVLGFAAQSVGAQLVRPDTARVEPVIVSATRVPISAADVPSSVTVITGESLRSRGITSIVDALSDVPGIALARNGSFGGTTSLFLRGGQSNYTKVLIDGVAVNQSGGAFDFGTLTVDNIDRIEIVRGPASVVWGSDAVSGVINLITRSGSGAPGSGKVTLSARAGTYASRDVEAAALASSQPASYSLSLSRYSTDGIYSFNNRYAISVLSARARFRPDDRTDGALSIRYSDYAAHYPTDFTGAPVNMNAFRSEAKVVLGVDLQRRLSDLVSVRLSLGSAAADGGTDDAADSVGGSWSQTLDHVIRRSADARAVFLISGSERLTVGGQVEEQTQRSQSQSGGTFSFNSLFSAARRNRAAYAELVSVRHNWSGTLGARLDDNQEFGSFGTYRLAVRSMIPRAGALRASVGTGYREPSFFENYATGFVRGNPDLRPEHSVGWEAGLTHTAMAGKLSIDMVHFDQRFRDMIDYDGSSFEGPSYFNRARASSRGQELTAHLQLGRGITAHASATHLRTRVDAAGFSASPTALLVQDSSLLRRPRWSGSAGVAYTGATIGSVDLRVSRVGGRYDRLYDYSGVNAVRLPWHTLVEVSAQSAPVVAPRLDIPVVILGRVSNAANVRYESVAGFRAPGRMVMLGARAEF